MLFLRHDGHSLRCQACSHTDAARRINMIENKIVSITKKNQQSVAVASIIKNGRILRITNTQTIDVIILYVGFYAISELILTWQLDTIHNLAGFGRTVSETAKPLWFQ